MSVVNLNIYNSLVTLHDNLARHHRLIEKLQTYSDTPIPETNTFHRCLQIVSRNLAANLSLQCDTIASFLQTGRTLESLEEELEPLTNQYDKHRRLWLMFVEHIPVRQHPRIAAQ